MRKPLSVLVLALASMALPACDSGDEVASLQKDVVELREEVQRAKKENEKLSSQLAAQARRIDGLSSDLTPRHTTEDRVREMAENIGSGPVDGPLPQNAAASPAAAPTLSPEDVVAIRTFLGTPDGRKVVTDAIEAERDAREIERDKRRADAMVDRFAKTAALTEDQTKRMKDIMGRAVVARRGLGTIRDLGPDATPEERDAFRTEYTTKRDALSKQTDSEVSAVLDSKQFDTYQQQQQKLRQAARGAQSGNGRNGNNPRPAEPDEN